jgi:hypothetical protein
MRHSAYQRMLALSFHGVLDERSEEKLTRHLAGCPSCRNERAALEKMADALKRMSPEFISDDAVLNEARRGLHVLLRREALAAQRKGWGRLLMSGDIPARLRLAAGLALVLVAGILVGRFVFPGTEVVSEGPGQVMSASLSSPWQGKTQITNVQFVDRGNTSGTVDFTFDAVMPVRMRGRVDDPAIQRVLVGAVLHDDNPGVRLTAVNAIGAVRPVTGDSEIEAALIRALRSDPNAGVRKQALVALRRMQPDKEIKKAFLETLMSDTNPGLRVAAINALDEVLNGGETIDPAIREILQHKAVSDNNDYVRSKAKAVLLERQ